MCNCGLERWVLEIRRDHREAEVQQFRRKLAWRKIQQTWRKSLQHCLRGERGDVGQHLAILSLVVEFDSQNVDIGRSY
jgi:hypothetical protein